MSNPFEILRIYTWYEGAIYAIAFVLPLISLIVYSFIRTNYKAVVKTQLFTMMSYLILLLGISWILQVISFEINQMIQLAFVLSYVVVIFNLYELTELTIFESKASRSDVDHITRKHFKLTLESAVLTLIVTASAVILLEASELWIFALFALVTILSLALGHFFARLFIKD